MNNRRSKVEEYSWRWLRLALRQAHNRRHSGGTLSDDHGRWVWAVGLLAGILGRMTVSDISIRQELEAREAQQRARENEGKG